MTAALQTVLWLFTYFAIALAGGKDKPHGHQGIIEPYTGKPLPLNLTPDQLQKLEKGEAVRQVFFSMFHIFFSYFWLSTGSLQ